MTQGKRVLLVEDNDLNRNMMVRRLNCSDRSHSRTGASCGTYAATANVGFDQGGRYDPVGCRYTCHAHC